MAGERERREEREDREVLCVATVLALTWGGGYPVHIEEGEVWLKVCVTKKKLFCKLLDRICNSSD